VFSCMPGNYRASGALTPRHATVGRLVSVGHDLNCGIGVKGTKLWAGECVASEPTGSAPPPEGEK
jgi:hypothetical protein